MRSLRVIKLVKIFKFYDKVMDFFKNLNIQTSILRTILILLGSFFLVHIFACFFYLSAKMNDLSMNTWVGQKDMVNSSKTVKYSYSIYWAFQTLTTVGYGDFGAYNSFEILTTCVWMFIGVLFYTFVVGSMTSIITLQEDNEQMLAARIMALEELAKESGMDPDFKRQIKLFLKINYVNMF